MTACISLLASLVAFVVSFQSYLITDAYQVLAPPSRQRSPSALCMAGKGMGMGAPTKKKGSQKKRNGKAEPFNVSASLLRLEKKYDKLMLEAAKNLQKEYEDEVDTVTTEYIIAARAEGYISDWVPIASLCLARSSSAVGEGVSDPLVTAAVSLYCREFSHVAALGSRVFQSVPRSLLQYAVESMDSFHKHVYEPAMEGKNNGDGAMNKQQARQVLELSDGADKSEIKRQYRKMSFEWHPDRFGSIHRTESDIEVAAERYYRIKLAYECLISGMKDDKTSWYQSMGGKSRTDFTGPLVLLSLSEAKNVIESSGVSTAVVRMEPEIVQGFVARSRQ